MKVKQQPKSKTYLASARQGMTKEKQINVIATHLPLQCIYCGVTVFSFHNIEIAATALIYRQFQRINVSNLLKLSSTNTQLFLISNRSI